jgi:S-adenosylmethionine hydrolase
LAQRPIVTLTTDFGFHDHFVGTVKGVILNIIPDAEIVDISHAVQAFDVLDGALSIAQAYSYFPSGTVHLVVVDPGVGTARRPIIASTGRHLFVAPDNGVLSFIYSREGGLQVHNVTAEHYYLKPVSQTFHARDIFAPITAYLAKGIPPAKFGEETSNFVRLDIPAPRRLDERTVRGSVLKVDHFGNLITNLTPQDVPSLLGGTALLCKIAVGGRTITTVKTSYADGAADEVFGILGSAGYLEIVVNRGSAAQVLGVAKGCDVDVTLPPA